jgi:hypothetical protein
MTRTVRLTALTALAALVAMAVAPGAGATATTQPSDLRIAIAAKARAAGIDPVQLFAGTVTVPRPQADHTFKLVETTVGQALDELSALGGSSSRDAGPAGTPEVAAGDTAHFWSAAGSGSQLLAITQSAVVPATPSVVLPPPATILAIEYGGPLTHIVGDYDFGLHTAGTLAGSSVDTGPGAPTPVWLPVVSAGAVSDTAIDFLGHALFFQDEFCIFGYCVAFGGMVADGLMIFDNTLPLGLPSIP